MYKVGIIGTGKIGSHLAEQLLYNKDISEINLANRDKERLEGRLISLKLRSHFIGDNKKIKKLDWNNINENDLIVICIKDNYDPRKLISSNGFPSWFPNNLRYVGLFKDLPLLELICNTKLVNYKGIVAVITNPVEITTFFIQKWLPNTKVFGLGASLDSFRLSYIIMKELGIRINNYDCIVAGEHGNDLTLISNIMVENIKLNNITSLQLIDYLNKAKILGFEIVKNLGFSLQDCTPVFSDDILWLLKKTNNYRTFAISMNNRSISIPIIFKNNEVILYDNFNEDEKKQISQVERRLSDFCKKLEENFEL